VFVEDIYRHIKMDTNQTFRIQDIDVSLYYLNQDDYNNCKSGNCEYYLNGPSGVSNITAVNEITRGSPVPIVVSQPHFFQADYYRNSVIFLPPNDQLDITKHNTFLWVEPYTGITMQAQKRLQVNLQMQGSFILYPNMPKTYVPVVWFEQIATITPDLASQWRNTVGVAVALLLAVPILGYSLAGLMLLLSGSMFVLAYTRKPPRGYSTIEQPDIQNSFSKK